MSGQGLQALTDALVGVVDLIGDQPLGADLGLRLNEALPAGGTVFGEISALCRRGVAEGWLAERERGGVKYGRAVVAGPQTRGFSVDVVEMNDLAGPRHAHPNGEIDMIMPIDAPATFDGVGEGWLVYGPGSIHAPTVRHGKAIILYLLPEGAIDFKPAG